MRTLALLTLCATVLFSSLAHASPSALHHGCIKSPFLTCETGWLPKSVDGCFQCVQEKEPSCIQLNAGQLPTIECDNGFHESNVGGDCWSCVKDVL